MGRGRRLEPIDKDYEELGKRLASLRKEKGLTQRDLAAALGISKTSVANYETGTRKVSLTLLKSFADFFDVSLNELMGVAPQEGDDLRMTIAGNLRACRSAMDLSREEISAEIGISVEDLKRYERGGGDMPLPVIIQLAKFYQTSLDNLVGLTVGTDGKSFTFVETDSQRRAGYQQWKDAMGDYSLTADQIQELITFAQFLKFRDSENK